MNACYWLSPTAEAIKCKDHNSTAIDIILNLRMPKELLPDLRNASAWLLARNWIRVVACNTSTSLYFERWLPPSEKQMAELKNLAIEHRLRLDDGKHIID